MLIGGAFATGQEAMQFFVGHGAFSLPSLIICLLLMVYTSWSLMRAGKTRNLVTHEQAFRYFCGDIMGVAMTWYTITMIVTVYGVMLSGVGATLEQAYGLPTFIGSGLMAFCAAGTLLLGLKGIIKLLSVIGPAIVFLTIATAISSFFSEKFNLEVGLRVATETILLRASDNWLFSGILYVGLAMPGLAAFLPLLGVTAESQGQIRGASLLGPVGFVVAMALVVLALMGHLQLVAQAEVPILVLAAEVFPLYGSIFAIVIFLGIYTTVTPLLWAVCRRFSSDRSNRFKLIAIGLTLLCLVGGNLLPFGEMINLIYPSIGYVGLFLLFCLVFRDIQSLVRR